MVGTWYDAALWLNDDSKALLVRGYQSRKVGHSLHTCNTQQNMGIKQDIAVTVR